MMSQIIPLMEDFSKSRDREGGMSDVLDPSIVPTEAAFQNFP